ncbi:hypothetical protein [Paenibacillus stellifer]|nr:hypothetical protein [Paenibacillus stellifer]
MEWYTFGQMLIHLRLGQKAATPDGRTLVRRPEYEELLAAYREERGRQ